VRYFVQILLGGGIDAIYTTDPHVRSEVEPAVDIPYAPSEIVHAGGMRLGPHMASFAPLCDRLAMLRGVRVDTANHASGLTNFRRLRRRAQMGLPTVLELCASLGQGPGAPPFGVMETPWMTGAFDELFAASPDLLGELADALDDHANPAGPLAGSARGRTTLASYADAGALVNRLRATPRLEVETWSENATEQQYAAMFQRLLWVLKHDLTRTVYMALEPEPESWDTHYANTRRQTEASSHAFPMLTRFLSELHGHHNPRGSLFDQTAVVMGSEIGRFPHLNTLGGKDHFPEVSVLLYGAAFEPAWGKQLGATGRQMESLTVSPRTGVFERGGAELCLDDIGATLLSLAGADDASVYGYARGPLRYVMA
jgi:hypothetical protein